MGIRVLIAEDDASVRDMLALALSFEENIDQLTFAKDGEVAIELCAQIKPHVFITDSLLPKMSGAEVARHCRTVNPEVRVISFSGMEIKTGDWPDEVVPKGDPDALDRLKRAIQAVSTEA